MPRSLFFLFFSAICFGSSMGCSLGQKKIAPKLTYRSNLQASADGSRFSGLLELLELVEKAKPACRAIDRKLQTKAQYLVTLSNSHAISIDVKECESSSPENCRKLKECLELRPVPWVARASGRTPEQIGVVYTDWIGRCGGSFAVNLYYGPQFSLPIERVGCVEPVHDEVDPASDLFLVDHANQSALPAAGPHIEALLKKWNRLVFSATDSLPLLNQ